MASAGLVAGVLITLLIIYASAQSVMLKEQVSLHGFEGSVELFEESATEQGWSIPTVHDMQKTMDKFGKDVVEAKVFELCHPEHAFEILSRDKERIVMSMMPCRVAIYKKIDGKTYVSWMNTGLMGSMMKGVVPKVMKNASRESEQIILPLIK
ncbi:MAG: DUF302 domain-containing protein [Bacteroidales bacterium]|nr:DUF302 domain-containing protein [Bacteroidales bacterium]